MIEPFQKVCLDWFAVVFIQKMNILWGLYDAGTGKRWQKAKNQVKYSVNSDF